jgi:Putative beta-barrel porin-2, OmpL-like. bbp2
LPVRRYRQGAAGANHRAGGGGGSATLGFGHDASTYGGAILASYAVNDNVSVAGRAEYINSSGSIKNGAPNLLYGPGSSAWSVTFTPTYQEGIWFVREELSYVLADSTTPGLAFGRSGNRKSQARVMIEGGVVF